MFGPPCCLLGQILIFFYLLWSVVFSTTSNHSSVSNSSSEYSSSVRLSESISSVSSVTSPITSSGNQFMSISVSCKLFLQGLISDAIFSLQIMKIAQLWQDRSQCLAMLCHYLGHFNLKILLKDFQTLQQVI